VLFRKLEKKIHQLEIANQAIADSEKKLRLITEKMTDIVWTADLSLRTTYVSPSIQNVLGFTQAERMRQPVNEQLTPASLSLGLEALASELTLEGQQNVDPQRKKTLVL
jgi:PAS domain S-box-containing protein